MTYVFSPRCIGLVDIFFLAFHSEISGKGKVATIDERCDKVGGVRIPFRGRGHDVLRCIFHCIDLYLRKIGNQNGGPQQHCQPFGSVGSRGNVNGWNRIQTIQRFTDGYFLFQFLIVVMRL